MSDWRLIPDYEASSDGEIQRCTPHRGKPAGTVLRPQTQRNGYQAVALYRDGRSTRRTVHTLVWEAFHGPRTTGMEVNHLDGVKAHNALANLELCTSTQNKAHAARMGLSATGARNAATRLTDEDVREIRRTTAEGAAQRAVALRFGVSQGHVSDIVRGRKRAAA